MPQKLAKGTRVRFSDEWLTKCLPAEAKRYQGRIGTVEGYRLGADAPIVLFPKEGRRKEQRLFEVGVHRLVVVADQAEA